MNSLMSFAVCVLSVILSFMFLFANTQRLMSDKEQENSTEEIPIIDDKGFGDYFSWWQNVLGLASSATDEPDVPVTAVDLKTCPACECGVARKVRIVGGHHVKQVNMYPWVAALLYKGRFYCGGSLINEKYVLTAAHCVHKFDKKHLAVRLMDHDRSTPNETVLVERRVDRIVKHKGYSARNFNNDIALIRLSEPINFTKSANRDENPSPVCLPVEGKSFAGYQGLVVGWGTTKAGGSTSNVLQEVDVPIMSNEDCKKTAYGESRITANMLCAGVTEGGKDSCQGDSGGPLKIVNGTNHYIVGIVSWGEGCAVKDYPGVYARVNRYLNWIHDATADACPCPYTKIDY